MNDDNAKVAAAFLIGGLVGAAVALLYAPKSGRETRREITKATKRLKNDTVELVEDTIESVNSFVGEVKEKVTDLVDRGKDLSESARKEVMKTLEHGQKVIEKQKSRIAEGLGL